MMTDAQIIEPILARLTTVHCSEAQLNELKSVIATALLTARVDERAQLLDGRPREVDPPELIRNALIRLRDDALHGMKNPGHAVLLSHAIAWLGYLVVINARHAAQRTMQTDGPLACITCGGNLDNNPAIVGAVLLANGVVCGECAHLIYQHYGW